MLELQTLLPVSLSAVETRTCIILSKLANYNRSRRKRLSNADYIDAISRMQEDQRLRYPSNGLETDARRTLAEFPI